MICISVKETVCIIARIVAQRTERTVTANDGTTITYHDRWHSIYADDNMHNESSDSL